MDKDAVLQALPQDHVKGSPNSKIILIQYGDFQCPYTAAAFPVVFETAQRRSTDVTFIFRHYPLLHIHPHSLLASAMAEAAARQDRFWEMAELLLEDQESLTPESAIGFAVELELDQKRFEHDVRSLETAMRIRTDLETGRHLGVKKTPSFLINGKLFQDEWHESGLRHQVDALL